MGGKGFGKYYFIYNLCPLFVILLIYNDYMESSKNQPEPEKLYIRPADKSLAAYKGSPRETVLVPAAMFTPPPKVDSVFLVIPLHEVPPVKAFNEPLFYQVVSAAFVMRRKTLANNLMRAFSLQRDQALSCIQSAGLPALIRGERLTLPEFASLSNQIQGFLNNQQKEINS